ncbi:CD83 antigen [Clinocottus analis]|uniref:CD83 antigen n=1 Tax=Clinocottus analis TaxID=304258 RepID=UPI0035BEC2EC
MMQSADIILALLLSFSTVAAEAQLEVEAVLGADCTLRCPAALRPGVQYRAVRWYKDGEPPASRLSGLLAKDLPNGTTRWYSGVQREVELLDESRDIFLPNVTCTDGGAYTCHMAAPVGEQNREGQVVLTLRECSPEKPLTDTFLVLFASVVMMLALLVFLISYFSLRNILKDRIKTPLKETLLDAALHPLDEKDLRSIYTLGPKACKPHSIKYVCV